MQDSVNSNIDCYFEFQYFYMKWLPLASLFFNVIYLAFHCRFWVSSKIIWFCVQCQLFRLFWEAFSRCRELDWVFQCREFRSLSLKLCFSSVSYDGIQDLPQTIAQSSFITLPAALQYLPSFGKTIILHSII